LRKARSIDFSKFISINLLISNATFNLSTINRLGIREKQEEVVESTMSNRRTIVQKRADLNEK
jgi:hypothetical protein